MTRPARTASSEGVAGRTRSQQSECPDLAASFWCPRRDHDFCLANEEFDVLSECIFTHGRTEMYEVLQKIQWRLDASDKGYYRQAYVTPGRHTPQQTMMTTSGSSSPQDLNISVPSSHHQTDLVSISPAKKSSRKRTHSPALLSSPESSSSAAKLVRTTSTSP